LDYIFINEPLYDAMVNSTALDFYEAAIIGSDHMPMTGVFNLHYDEIDLSPPLPVSNVSIVVESDKSTITWDHSQDEELFKYSVYRNDCLITDLDTDINSFVDDYEYESNVIYIYDVSATDQFGHESLLSNLLLINTSYGILEKPSTPILSSTKLEDDKILLEWLVEDNGGINVDYYQLYRSTSVEGPWSRIESPTTTNSTKSLISDVVIFYRIRAHNFIGYSLYSNIVSDDVSTLLNTKASTNAIDNPIPITNIRVQPANCPTPLVILEVPVEVNTTTTTTPPTSTPTQATPFPIAGIVVFMALMAILPIKRRNN
jgi:hypothetical protein